MTRPRRYRYCVESIWWTPNTIIESSSHPSRSFKTVSNDKSIFNFFFFFFLYIYKFIIRRSRIEMIYLTDVHAVAMESVMKTPTLIYKYVAKWIRFQSFAHLCGSVFHACKLAIENVNWIDLSFLRGWLLSICSFVIIECCWLSWKDTGSATASSEKTIR